MNYSNDNKKNRSLISCRSCFIVMISLVFILPFFCGIQNACAQNDLLSVEKTEHLFHRIIVRAADRHNIDPALIKAIIMAESRYNPGAVSKRGAKGLMQLMPKTAKSLGVKDIFDPEHNINGGVKYFKQLLDEFGGKVRLALAAYNAGSRKVKKYRGIPPYRATRRYIKNVFTYYQYYKDKMDEEAGRA